MTSLNVLEGREQQKKIGPQEGPQSHFLSTPADIAIFGGSAGGGKTFSLLLEPLRHIANPNFGAVVFRRTSVQVRNQGGLWDESKQLYPNIGGKPHEYDLWWEFPSGASISFAHLEHDKNVFDWQGSQIPLLCCEVGTKIRLSGGALKKVEDLEVGDLVETLQGPRRVTKTSKPVIEDCVEAAVYSPSGKRVGLQVQAKNHRILASCGWMSYNDVKHQECLKRPFSPAVKVFEQPFLPHVPFEPLSHYAFHREENLPKSNLFLASCASTQLLCDGKFALWSANTDQCAFELPCILYQDQQPFRLSSQSTRDRQYSPETFSYKAQEVQEIDCELSLQKHSKLEPQLSSLHSQERLEPFLQSHQSHISFAAQAGDELSYDRLVLEVQGSKVHYYTCTHPCDEHEHFYLNKNQDSVQLQVCVAEQNRKCLHAGDPGTIPEYNPLDSSVLYVHPYTGQARTSVKECQLLSCEMIPCGFKEVVHFTVDDENHYISENGLVNQNCFDEITHFSEQQFWYMLSRNRSGCGVRPYIRATCNPDADSWVANLIAWWINPDTGYAIPERSGKLRWFIRLGEKLIWADEPKELAIFTDPITGKPIPPKSLTFIPSSLADNKILALADPGYIANLLALPIVERERLLNGNWKIRWRGQTFFDITTMLDQGRPVAMPQKCDGIYAVLDTASKSGLQHDGTAAIYCARSKFFGTPVTILDYDYVQIDGGMLEAWLPEVFKRGEELAKQCGARAGFIGVWIEDKQSGTVLIQAAQKKSMKVRAINSKLTAIGKDERAFSISPHVSQGRVKIADEAYHKVVTFKNATRNHLLSQIEGFSIADKDASKRADDCLDVFVYSVAIALGNGTGF